MVLLYQADFLPGAPYVTASHPRVLAGSLQQTSYRVPTCSQDSGWDCFILKLWHMDLHIFKLNTDLVRRTDGAAHDSRREAGGWKCELGSCLGLSSRTGTHVPPVSPGVLSNRQVLG